MRHLRFLLIAICLCAVHEPAAAVWGFYGHKLINRLAVFSLPPPLFPFYRNNIFFLTQHAVKPDQRRYAVETEGPMHYIDMDMYPDTLLLRWEAAANYFDSIPETMWHDHGALPHRVNSFAWYLTEAFRQLNTHDILKYSAELGHYIGDAHVPLHTTTNYNGQLTGQNGIHGLWESRLPELFGDSYDLSGIEARYIQDINRAIWKVVRDSNAAVDSVLGMEKQLTGKLGNRIRAYDTRGNAVVYQFSREFSRMYHQSLNGMVERRLRASAAFTANIWYTCWINAGQPVLPVNQHVAPDTSVQKPHVMHPRNSLHD